MVPPLAASQVQVVHRISTRSATPQAAEEGQYRIDGRNAPAGSLYRPIDISVIGCTTRMPCFRHQRNTSALRDGSRIPNPNGEDGVAAIRAFMSSFVPPTACPR